jgi:hypothetical protein
VIPLDRMRARVDRAQQDSDVAYFFDLMYYGEFTLKLLTCAVLAALADDRDRNRYRLEHQLVRADSLGDWAQVLDDALAGPASQQFVDAGHAEQRELAKQWLPTDDVWQSRAVVGLHEVCKVLDPIRGALPAKITMRRWVADFAWLRNRTRGHGAPTAGKCAGACVHLRSSIDEVVASFVAFSRPWAHLHRSLSGKYRVTLLNGDPEPFQRFKRENWHPLPDGVYINYDELCKVPLVATDVDIADFKIANGGFKDARYELLSYITDDRELTDATGYLAPPTALPFSETHGTQELDVQGKSFGNIPPPLPDYVSRQMLEDEVRLASIFQ